uniref:Uncharacterized protein n=1 Tax=Onchocerca volvulus TaxID=6282 RepID=A0A8R1XP38_ONCVO
MRADDKIYRKGIIKQVENAIKFDIDGTKMAFEIKRAGLNFAQQISLDSNDIKIRSNHKMNENFMENEITYY